MGKVVNFYFNDLYKCVSFIFPFRNSHHQYYSCLHFLMDPHNSPLDIYFLVGGLRGSLGHVY